jgi:hypothetical protein
MTTQPVDHERLLVHNWRVARLTRLGIPGRWPRSTPTASTGTRSPGWPCASPADERTRDEGPRLPGTDSPRLPDRSRRSWTKSHRDLRAAPCGRASHQREVACDSSWLNSSLTVQDRAGALVEAPKPRRRS